MERRFIEEAFPIKEVSIESSQEKNLRHGYISTFHIWWARKPLAVSRAIAYASLVQAPETQKLLDEKKQFISNLSKWSNAFDFSLIKNAKKDILKSNNFQIPKVLDPFAGGGSIPLEALRLGCDTYATDYNPVSILMLKCTLEYPQKYGHVKKTNNELVANSPKNRLLDDTKKWGKWIFDEVKREIGKFYPEFDDGHILICNLWARTVTCQNPSCGAIIPLLANYWLSKSDSRKIALYPEIIDNGIKFSIVGTGYKKIPKDFNPDDGNISSTVATCLVCGSTIDAKSMRDLILQQKSSQQIIAIISQKKGKTGKKYSIVSESDTTLFLNAEKYLSIKRKNLFTEWGMDPIPDEPTPESKGKGAERAFSLRSYGLNRWGELFNSRQILSLVTFSEKIRSAYKKMLEIGYSEDYAKAISTYLAMGLDRLVDYGSTLSILNYTGGRGVFHTFSRQALSIVWNYAESNPFNPFGAGWITACEKNEEWITHVSQIDTSATVTQSSATSLTFEDNFFDAVLTDPPYYDMVPYSYLSDFFYVWLKRSIGHIHPDLFATPLTPKKDEIVVYSYGKGGWDEGKLFFENMLEMSFKEIHRVLKPNGISVIVYAHKSPEGWESLITSLLKSGLVVTAAWPINTEMKSRKRAQESASMASSIYMVTRKMKKEPFGFYRDIKNALKKYLDEKLDHLWNEGISGADFFISAIGSAIVVFGKYEKVIDDSDNSISVSKLLNDTREIVTNYAIQKVLHSEFSDQISKMTRFYILWRWAYGQVKVPFDDAKKMSQSIGVNLEHEWNKGFIMKEKENIRVLGPDERKIEDLEKSHELIDVLHYALILWKKNKKEELDKLLREKGFSKSDMFKRVAQAISESLPTESTEKKWIDGFLTGFRVDDSNHSQTKLF